MFHAVIGGRNQGPYSHPYNQLFYNVPFDEVIENENCQLQYTELFFIYDKIMVTLNFMKKISEGNDDLKKPL